MATMHIPIRAGWLPDSHDMKDWYECQVNKIPNLDRPWNDIIIEFKNLIESDPDIYMGFNRMFEQTTPDPNNPNRPQVCYISFSPILSFND